MHGKGGLKQVFTGHFCQLFFSKFTIFQQQNLKINKSRFKHFCSVIVIFTYDFDTSKQFYKNLTQKPQYLSYKYIKLYWSNYI